VPRIGGGMTGPSFDLRRCVPMTREEEHLCALEYAKTKSPLLASRLVAANLRLVVKIAYGYRRPQYDIADLVQEGNLGLLHGVVKYDPTRGIRLCSYAAWWIRAYILKYTLDNWRLVKAGTTETQRRLFFTLQKERSELERRGIEGNSRNLAAALDVREKDVVIMLERIGGAETSLDAPRGPAGHEEAWSLLDTLGDAPSLQPDVRLENADFARHLREHLKTFEDTLEGRELAIFRRRLLSDEPETLAALAADFGVSRERTRQLEERLKARIRIELTRGLGDALQIRRDAKFSYAPAARGPWSTPVSAAFKPDRRAPGRIIQRELLMSA
jgi:RNA polymerase sigma-32 factor